MFVVQDRETGLYYRNTAGGRGKRRNNGDWVADLQEVKPYRTMAAVRNAFSGVGDVFYAIQRRKWNKEPVAECCAGVKWSSSGGITRKCKHYKAAEAVKKAEARLRYRVLKISIVLGEEQEL